MRKTQTIIGTLALTTLLLGGLATPAGAVPMPAVALGTAYCEDFVLAPSGAAVVNPTTTEVLVNAVVVYESGDSCWPGTYELSVVSSADGCSGSPDSRTVGSTPQVFALTASIDRSSWEDTIAIACTIALSVPVGPDGEGILVVAHADIWIIEQ